MTPAAIPMAQQVIQELDSRELRKIAAQVLRLSSAIEIEQCLTEGLTRTKVLGSEVE